MLSWLSKIWTKTVLLFLILSSIDASAQEVPVADQVFADLLCQKFPDAMSADCKRLDTIKATSNYPSIIEIRFINAGINAADEILYFKNADTIYLNHNNLTSFPLDLSSFRSLGRLNLSNNELRIAPNIHYQNPISGDTAVKLVYLLGNKIDSLPPSWYQFNGFTQVVDIRINELENIPDFTNYPQIRRLDVRENRLMFDDLIPIKNHPLWATSQFDLFPQKEINFYDDIEVTPGETLELNFNTGNPGDTYTLLKNDRNFMFSNDGLFVLNDISTEDTATYWVKIRNDLEFPNDSDFLKSTKFKLVFKEGLAFTTSDELQIFSPDGDGQDDLLFIDGEGEAVFFDKNGRKILNKNLPYSWDGLDRSGHQVQPGLYIIKKANDEYIKVLVSY